MGTSPLGQSMPWRRQNFAHPIRRAFERATGRQTRHAFAAPAADVRNEHLSVQVKLGLIQNDPTTGATSPTVKRCIQLA